MLRATCYSASNKVLCCQCGKPLIAGAILTCSAYQHTFNRNWGLGTCIGKFLELFHIKKRSGCGCYSREARLNNWSQKMYFTCVGLWNRLFGRTLKDLRRKKLLIVQETFPRSTKEDLEQYRKDKTARREYLLALQTTK